MCDCKSQSGNATQTLDEMDFERGLWFAAQYGDVERALYLLNKGFYVDQRDAAGYTPLHYAARNGHVSLTKLLLDRGACVNAVTQQGNATSLHRAATVGHAEVANLLIEHGGDCQLKDVDGKTALHRAAQNQHEQICQILVNLHPDLKHQQDNCERKPMDFAQSARLKELLC